MRFRIRHADRIVGLFVILAGVALLGTIVMAGASQRWFARDFRFATILVSAANAAPGTGVFMRGFQVGKIEKVRLSGSSEVRVDFVIYDSYRDQARRDSIIEIVTSPIGLGTQILFHPGKSLELLDEGSIVPEASTQEGKALIDAGLVEMPRKDDTITRLLAGINPLIEDVGKTVVSLNQTLTEVNRALAGEGSTPVARIVENAAGAVEGVNRVVATADRTIVELTGQVNGLVGTADRTIAGLSGQVDSVVGSVDRTLAGLSGQVDGLLASVDRTLADVTGQVDSLVGTANRTIDGIGGDVDGLVGTADTTIKDINGEVAGLVARIDGITADLSTVTANLAVLSASLSDPTGLVPKLLDPQGSIKTFLDDDNKLYDGFARSVSDIESALNAFYALTGSLNAEVPGIAAAILDMNKVLKDAQDVLQGLKNNALIKGGIPERIEEPAVFQSLREGLF